MFRGACDDARDFVPNEELGTYLSKVWRDQSWLCRRTDTLTFTDDRTTVLTSELEIDSTVLRQAWEAAAPRNILHDGSMVPVPLTNFRKQLLIDMRLEVAGRGSPLPPRPENALASASLLCSVARALLDGDALEPAVQAHIYSIADCFPPEPVVEGTGADREMMDFEDPRRLPTPAATVQWGHLMRVRRYRELARLLYRDFLLFASLDIASGTTVVQFARALPVADETQKFLIRSGLEPHLISLRLNSPLARSYHLRVQAPHGMAVVNAAWTGWNAPRLLPLPDNVLGPAPAEGPLEDSDWGERTEGPAYDVAGAGGRKRAAVPVPMRVLNESQAHLYFPWPRPLDAVVAVVSLRMRTGGFLRSAWLVSWFSVFSVLPLFRFKELEGVTEAAAALLLIGPSMLAAYVARPPRHPLVGKIQLPLRYAAVIVATLPYWAAVAFVAEVPEPWLTRCLLMVVLTGLVIVGLYSRVLTRTRRDLRQVPTDARTEPLPRHDTDGAG